MEFLQQGIEQTAPPVVGISDFLPGSEMEPTAQTLNKRAIRWIVFAGNVLPPKFTREVVEMRMGGENLAESCMSLKRASNGYLRRCQITPMSIGYDWLNADSIDPENTKAKSRTRWDEKLGQQITDYYYECLPGDEIETLLSWQQGAGGLFDIGIREVECLFNERASEPGSAEFNAAMTKGRNYQYLIFPDWADYLNGRKEFFATTPSLEAYLLKRKAELDDQIALDIIDVLLESNTQFERYATTQLLRMKDTIEAGKAEGVIHSWAPNQRMWFPMLNINEEAFLQRKSDGPSASSGVSREEFQAQGEKLDKLADAVTQVLPAIGQLAEIAVAGHETKQTTQPETEKVFFAIGDVVQVKDRGQGLITAKPYGKYKINLDSGEEEVFKLEELSRI